MPRSHGDTMLSQSVPLSFIFATIGAILVVCAICVVLILKFKKLNRIDPYDSIVLASAIECNCDYIITRDKIFIKKGKELMDLLTPEEFLDKLKLSLG